MTKLIANIFIFCFILQIPIACKVVSEKHSSQPAGPALPFAAEDSLQTGDTATLFTQEPEQVELPYQASPHPQARSYPHQT